MSTNGITVIKDDVMIQAYPSGSRFIVVSSQGGAEWGRVDVPSFEYAVAFINDLIGRLQGLEFRLAWDQALKGLR